MYFKLRTTRNAPRVPIAGRTVGGTVSLSGDPTLRQLSAELHDQCSSVNIEL
jgi:hypothetical protein